MGAAALVLALSPLAVLVRADRDVLGAVVGGDFGAAQRKRSRRDGEEAAHELLRGGTEPRRRAHELDDDRASEHRREHAWTLERQARFRQSTADLRNDRQRVGEPGRPAQQRALDLRAAEPLAPRYDLQLAVVGADGASPRGGAVDEDAVREGHATEPHLVVAHVSRVARGPFAPRAGGS